MKVLNCANCGANLKFNSGDPVTICGFCDSVNILENIKLKIEQPLSSSNDGPPNFIEDLKPRILLPQLSYRAKFRQGEYIGILGKFLISNTEIFFKPGKFNWGDLSDKYMKIVNINNMSIKKLGLATQLTITDNNGKEMRIVHSFLDFTNIKLNEVVSEINIRKNNLVLKK